MIRIVLDTSSLVSAVISPAGPNAQLFDFIIANEIRPYVTDAVLDEYSRVFEYERLQHLDRRRIARLRTVLKRVAVKVKPTGAYASRRMKRTIESTSARPRPKPITSSRRT